MPTPVWSEESLRSRAKSIGYYVCRIMGYRHDYWYLVKPRKDPTNNPFFRGRDGEDFIPLGPLSDPDSISGIISYIESQQKLRVKPATCKQEGDDDE